jgi:hypothetical protein
MIKLTKKQEKRFPKTVPWLRAKDLVRGRYDSPNGERHCLVGWARQTFGPGTEEQTLVVRCLRERADKGCLKGLGGLNEKTHVPHVNDNLQNKKLDVAQLWNETMRLDFGYQHLMDRDA